MTDATEQSKIMEAAHEAAAIARGEMPAGRWTIKGMPMCQRPKLMASASRTRSYRTLCPA